MGDDEAKLRFPGMAVAIDKAWYDDGVDRLDHLCASGIDLRGDGGDLCAFNQQIAFHQIADLGIHGDDGAAFEENAVVRIDYRLAFKAPKILCGGGSETTASHPSPCESGAHRQRSAT